MMLPVVPLLLGVLQMQQNAGGIYADREYVSRNIFQRIFAQRYVSPQARTAYSSLHFEKSLLLSDCGQHPNFSKTWCGDADWTLNEVLKRTPKKTLDEAAVRYAIATAGGNDPDLADGVSRFELTGVVNRLDLARRNGNGDWEGAELRFIYGLVGESDGADKKVEVIVEFVHKPMDWPAFRKLAGSWQSLSQKQLDKEEFATALNGVLREQFQKPWEKVRLRAEILVGGRGIWTFMEWSIDGGAGLKPEKLADQIYGSCASGSTGPECGGYLGYWGDLEKLSLQSQAEFGVPPALRPEVILGMSTTADPLGTPKGFCKPTQHARNVIALRQCTHCHGVETQTNFVHVETREPGKRQAKLSQFLKGAGNDKPEVRSLARGRNEPGFEVVHSYDEYSDRVSGDCKSSRTVTVRRKFNDLARRGLFLAEVLARDEKTPPSKAEAEVILQYGPRFGH